ncbi:MULTISPECIES: diguanylate cyclase [unclassified Fusibacter]|uniref:sensor domain-containing diguanylate cyclase n=1 Tax=unclassified Fusibacter TaxID=2624464 RepID=UPI0013E90A90|nr:MULTISPECIES: diguanylate cyclase [unclassified Fusibacter]MCK8058352.1 diguanylate cyclase [Fusibacter sp. A2]NPE20935.1 diguanylate cyclase [Fusibacter sp. A1]
MKRIRHYLNKENFRITKLGLIQSALASSIMVIIWGSFFIYNYQQNRQQQLSVELDELDHLERIVHEYVRDASNILLGFSDSESVKILLKESPETMDEVLSDIFLSISRNAKNYNQMRLLDALGMEVVRVDRSKEGSLKVVTGDELQYKGDRYYFTETKALGPHEIFLSPFDLNIEHGEIEVPYNPMVRLSMPLYGDNQEFYGIIIINVMGQQLIDELQASMLHPDELFYMTDENGYYINHPDPTKTFGFMFEDKKDVTIQNDFPEVWEALSENRRTIRTEDGRFFLSSSQMIDSEKLNSSDRSFKFIMQIPSNTWSESDVGLIVSNMIFLFFIEALIIIAALLLGSQQEKNKEYRNEIERMALTDRLTGVSNRHDTERILSRETANARRYDYDLAIIYIDVNNLKSVNDNLGHAVGDEMIICATQAVLKSIRETDYIGRIGGDEFLIILPHCAVLHVTRIIKKASDLFLKMGQQKYQMDWTFSDGVAMYDGSESSGDLMKRADKEMYRTKKAFKAMKDQE